MAQHRLQADGSLHRAVIHPLVHFAILAPVRAARMANYTVSHEPECRSVPQKQAPSE